MDPALLRGAIRASGAGLQFAASMVIFSWLGGRLDGWIHTSPWGLLGGALLGLAGGLFLLVRTLQTGETHDPGDEDRS